MSKTFLHKVKVKEVLDTMLWGRELTIFNNTEDLFKKNKLDVYNAEDYEFFQSNLMHQFLFSKKYILNRVRYYYLKEDYKELKDYITRIEEGELQQVIIDSGLYSILQKFLDNEITQIQHFIVPKYIEFLINKHKPIKLNVHYNNKSVKATNLRMDVIVETNNADHRRVSILDKKNNQILKPEGYTYDQIQKIIVKYKNKDFVFVPDSIINYYPHQFKELNSMISEYSFNKIPIWEIEVLETKGHIGVKLTNVIESKVIKKKRVRLKLKKRRKSLKN